MVGKSEYVQFRFEELWSALKKEKLIERAHFVWGNGYITTPNCNIKIIPYDHLERFRGCVYDMTFGYLSNDEQCCLNKTHNRSDYKKSYLQYILEAERSYKDE